MDRKKLQRLAKERLQDAKALLGRKRWGCSYYICGYAIECGLKACLLRHLGESGSLYGDPAYLKKLAECWTRDLVKLVGLAGLETEFGTARGANVALDRHWVVAKEWKETARYDEKNEAQARELFEAVSHNPDGVFRWVQSHW